MNVCPPPDRLSLILIAADGPTRLSAPRKGGWNSAPRLAARLNSKMSTQRKKDFSHSRKLSLCHCFHCIQYLGIQPIRTRLALCTPAHKKFNVRASPPKKKVPLPLYRPSSSSSSLLLPFYQPRPTSNAAASKRRRVGFSAFLDHPAPQSPDKGGGESATHVRAKPGGKGSLHSGGAGCKSGRSSPPLPPTVHHTTPTPSFILAVGLAS